MEETKSDNNFELQPSKSNKLVFAVIGIVVLATGLAFVFFSAGSKTPPPSVEAIETTAPADSGKTFTLSEVSGHSSASDCWMAVSGKVYDVTKFIPQHPGGSEILRGCGQDATELFATQGRAGGRGHSGTAQALLKSFYIGELQ